MNNTRYSFWQLIQENRIEIPIIQRDYAQGRNDNKTQKIRALFLKELHDKIEDESEPVNLDFVYGRIEDKTLTPLDGQQRLTTLFLLHWYLALKDNLLSDSNRKILKRFTYQTRFSSRKFCESLIDNAIILDSNKVSKNIENKNWFYKSWKKDPTVKSMLQMIDDIDEKFKNTNGLFNKLINIDNPPITFDFLPLQDFELTDELYIKMNARGKPLTDFEDFKAKFLELLEGDDISKLDNDWTDLFWKYKVQKNDGYYYIDDKFLNFFTNVTINFFVETNEIEKTKIDSISAISIYNNVYAKKNNNISRIVKLLDSLRFCKNKLILEKFEDIIDIEGNIGYQKRVEFYIVSLFLIKYNNISSINQQMFDNWIRVTFTLIDNTLIQSTDDLAKAIRSIQNLFNYVDELYTYLGSIPRIDFFLQSQVKEEIIKAILILKNETWKRKILDTEETLIYFKNQIGFLLNFIGAEEYFEKNKNCEWNQNMDTIFQDKFLEYLKITKLLFNSEGLNQKYTDYMFERALLTKGNYLLPAVGNYSFVVNRGKFVRDISWKRLLRDNKREYIKNLFDDLLRRNTNTTNIESHLDNIRIESNIIDWRKYFIKYPKLIDACGNYKFIRKYNNDILLLKKERTSAEHREYNTYALYIELRSQNIDVAYFFEYEKYLTYKEKKITWNIEKQKFMILKDLFSFDEAIVKIKNL